MNTQYESVWDAIEDSPQERANLRLRSELMLEIARDIRRNGWTQVEAAQKCGISQPRVNDLLRGKITKFSLIPLSTSPQLWDTRSVSLSRRKQSISFLNTLFRTGIRKVYITLLTAPKIFSMFQHSLTIKQRQDQILRRKNRSSE